MKELALEPLPHRFHQTTTTSLPKNFIICLTDKSKEKHIKEPWKLEKTNPEAEEEGRRGEHKCMKELGLEPLPHRFHQTTTTSLPKNFTTCLTDKSKGKHIKEPWKLEKTNPESEAE